MRAVATLAVLLTAAAGLHMLAAAAVTDAPPALAAVLFWQSEAPRVLMALTVGGALGLAGAAMQEVTRNPLASPTTVGTVSGAWVALVVATLVVPDLAARFGPWICLVGGGLTTAAVLAVAGPMRMQGVVVIIVGMAMNLTLAAVAVVLTLLAGEVARGTFIWRAGDLTQTGWETLIWTAPQCLAGALLFLAVLRPLAVLRLGQTVASGRGVPTVGVSIVTLGLAVWLTSAAVAAVGAIGFVGLVAPHIVRGLGVRSTGGRLILSAAAGAAALLACDAVPVALSHWSRDLIPTGAAAALIGAPALILLAWRGVRTDAQPAFGMTVGRTRLPAGFWPVLSAACASMVVVALGLGVTVDGFSWSFAPMSEGADALLFALRWPSVVAAAAAGLAMAVSGVILQRLLRNPLASPDILGVTSGAMLAIVFAVVFLGGPLVESAAPAAVLGALAVTLVLRAVWRRRATPPDVLILTGIALAALLDALVQFALARGGDEAYSLLVWLTGATFLASAEGALALLAVAVAVLAAAVALRRWLTLMTLGDHVAEARGMPIDGARRALLWLVAGATAAVVACVGPVTFIGLLAPHAAALLGARRAGEQLAASALIGVGLLVAAELAGRLVAWPDQLPAGIVASLLGGLYLFALIVGSSFRRAVLPG